MRHRHRTPIHLEDTCPDGKIGNLVYDFLLRITKDSGGQLAGEGLACELSRVRLYSWWSFPGCHAVIMTNLLVSTKFSYAAHLIESRATRAPKLWNFIVDPSTKLSPCLMNYMRSMPLTPLLSRRPKALSASDS